MNKRTKYTKAVEKQHKIFESAKVQKIEASNGTFFLEEGDKFQLIPIKYLKEQSVESQAIADTIVSKINANLKDESIEVKVVSDNSETLNGVATTNITFEICVKEDRQSDMVKMGVAGIDFEKPFDDMLNEVIAGEGFKADEVTIDHNTNTFTINRVVVEGIEEEPTTDVGIDFSSDDEIVVEDSFIDDTYEDEYVEEDIYYESATKKSRYKEGKTPLLTILKNSSTYTEFYTTAIDEGYEDYEVGSFFDKNKKLIGTNIIESATKKSKYTKIILSEKAKKEEADDVDSDEEDDEEELEEKNKPKKDKNGKYPFEKGYIKEEEEDEEEDSDEDDEKETKEEKKKVKESWKSSDDRFKHYL